MPETQAQPRLLVPGLKPFYDWAIPLVWPLIRIAVGWNLVVHAWIKLQRGVNTGSLAIRSSAWSRLGSSLGARP